MPEIDEGNEGTYKDLNGILGIDHLSSVWHAVPTRWKPAKWWKHHKLWASGVIPWCPYCGVLVAGRNGQHRHQKNIHGGNSYVPVPGQDATASNH